MTGHDASSGRPDSVPLLRAKNYSERSIFTAENLLREGRRQRNLPAVDVPEVCLLDPDGDVVRHLRAKNAAVLHEGWACYHSELWTTQRDYGTIGIVPCAVGASYAVLVAEELHASGCRLVISVTSAGQISESAAPPYFILIQRAWRDEGTSLHYLPPSEWSHLDPELARRLDGAFTELDEPVIVGSSWTTDAPLRETPSAITAARAVGIDAVEMEASALYAYALARERAVVCIAHVTNVMATEGDDFEKGEDDGTSRILALIDVVAGRALAPEPKSASKWGSDAAP